MATNNKRQFAKSEQTVVLPTVEIRPSPENDTLYRPISKADPEVIRLAESIGTNGLLEPLVISRDRYVISGHRRLVACHVAGVKSIRCRILPISRAGHPDEFLRLLREHNRQRIKTIGESLRESIVDINPNDAHDELIQYRREKAKVGHIPLSIGGAKTRREISAAKCAFCESIQRVVADRREFWPLSVRQVHYALLNDPPLKHSSKPDSTYRNDHESYKSLCDIVARMRLTGLIDWHAIGDETRPFVDWNVHESAEIFIAQQMNDFLRYYCRNLQTSQPNHIEVVVEKNTCAGIVKTVCAEACIPMTSGRGYCSLPPRYDMATRFRKSGKDKLIILLVSDFDPDGEEIAASFARSMRDDFHIAADKLHPIKVALTHEQVQKYKLPPSMEAKASSSRASAFVKRYGPSVWELESLPPLELQNIVRESITSVMDMDLFEQEQQAERQDAARLKGVREAMKRHLNEFMGVE